MEKIKNFKQLIIWQEGIEIVKRIYKLTKEFPKDEIYGLVAQMRRSAISVPSNIPEGFKRLHKKEFKQFLHISLGSLAELETQIIIARELELADKPKTVELLSLIEKESKMITSLSGKVV